MTKETLTPPKRELIASLPTRYFANTMIHVEVRGIPNYKDYNHLLVVVDGSLCPSFHSDNKVHYQLEIHRMKNIFLLTSRLHFGILV